MWRKWRWSLNGTLKSKAPPPPQAIPGPHICNQVGKNVLAVVRTALHERCEAGGGSISAGEIDQILASLSDMPTIFPIFNEAYHACDTLKRNFNSGSLTRDTLPRFVVLALCKDILLEVFQLPAQSLDHNWQSIVADGLIALIEQNINPDFRNDLFRCYQKLAAERGASLRTKDVLDSRDVQHQMRTVLASFSAYIAAGGSDAICKIERVINDRIGQHYHLSGSSPKKVNDLTMTAFFNKLLYTGARHNDFRNAVLTDTAHPAQAAAR